MLVIFLVLAISCVVAQDADPCSACPSCDPKPNPEFPTLSDLSQDGCAAKIVFLLDESGSLRNFRDEVVSAATAFWTGLSTLNGLGGNAQLGLIEFADTARVVQNTLRPLDAAYVQELNTYIQSQQGGVAGYSPSGTTDWGEALALANSVFTGDNSPDIVVFFTDGEPNGHDGNCDSTCYPFDQNNGDLGNACYEADKLKERGVKIFTVAVGDVIGNLPAIQVIAGGSVDSVPFGAGATAWDFQVESFGAADYVVDPSVTNLEARLQEVAAALCRPICEDCQLTVTNPNAGSQECTGRDTPALLPLEYSLTGDCGEPSIETTVNGFNEPCRTGSITQTVSVAEQCKGENTLTETFTTFVQDSTGPTLECPESGVFFGSCPESFTAINELTVSGADTCSDFDVTKSDVTPIMMDSKLTGYEVTFSARDACGNPSQNTCIVQYMCDDSADLEIKKTADIEDCAVAGDPNSLITYTVTATNLGPAVGRNVTVQETWPHGGVLQLVGDVVPTVGTIEMTLDGFQWNVGDLANGASATVTFSISLDSSFPASFIPNTASGTMDTFDLNLCNNVDMHETRVCRRSDLIVEKLSIDDLLTAGELLNGDALVHGYTIKVWNTGPSDASNVRLFDEWPNGFHRLNIQQCDGAVCTTGTGQFDCRWDSIPSGEYRFIVVPFTVPASTDSGCRTNSVLVLSDSRDPDVTNNRDDAVACVRTEADVGVSKTDHTESASAGDDIVRTYEITVMNHGPSDAHEVRLVDSWPRALSQVADSVTTSKGNCVHLGGGSFSCNLGTVGAQEEVVISASYTIDGEVDACDARNTADVRSTTFDANICNNEAVDVTHITERASLDVSKTAQVDSILTGDGNSYTYMIEVTNHGPSTARQVLLQDSWPFQFVQFKDSLQPSQGRCVANGGDFQCMLGDIAAGAKATILVHWSLSEISPVGIVGNVVTISSPTDDQCRYANFNIIVDQGPTPQPTTAAPTVAPSPAPTSVPVTASPTPSPTTASPTPPEVVDGDFSPVFIGAAKVWYGMPNCPGDTPYSYSGDCSSEEHLPNIVAASRITCNADGTAAFVRTGIAVSCEDLTSVPNSGPGVVLTGTCYNLPLGCEGTSCAASTIVTCGSRTPAPTIAPVTPQPTAAPVTPQPTAAPVTPQPTAAPVTPQPTAAPVTPQPTAAPVTPQPTAAPVTPQPTAAPVTPQPTAAPVTPQPTAAPVTPQPTAAPVTPQPTAAPVTPQPTASVDAVTLKIVDSTKGGDFSIIGADVPDARCFQANADWPAQARPDIGIPPPTNALKICDIYANVPQGWSFLTATWGQSGNAEDYLRTPDGSAFYTGNTQVGPATELNFFMPWNTCGSWHTVGAPSGQNSCRLAPLDAGTSALLNLDRGSVNYSWFCVPGASNAEGGRDIMMYRVAVDAALSGSVTGKLTIFAKAPGADDAVRADLTVSCF